MKIKTARKHDRFYLRHAVATRKLREVHDDEKYEKSLRSLFYQNDVQLENHIRSEEKEKKLSQNRYDNTARNDEKIDREKVNTEYRRFDRNSRV